MATCSTGQPEHEIHKYSKFVYFYQQLSQEINADIADGDPSTVHIN